MKKELSDHRRIYTQMVIHESLLKLLSVKPLNKIGITELCKDAKVSRGTFYNNFYDLFDVYEDIEKAFFEELKLKLTTNKVPNVDFFKEIMLFIKQNATLSNIIIKNKNNSDFLPKIIDYARDKFIKEWSLKYQLVSKDILDMLFIYTANGSISIISNWVYNDMVEPIEQIAQTIAKITNLILDQYFRK